MRPPASKAHRTPLFARIQKHRINGKIEYHAATLRHTCDKRQRRHASFAREIRRNAKPREKRYCARIESRTSEPFCESLFFEVHRHKRQRRRDLNASCVKLVALPRLRSRMIDL